MANFDEREKEKKSKDNEGQLTTLFPIRNEVVLIGVL